ncbi:PAS domain S-box protein [Nodosilinea sp. LEGE 07298]|uniref:PAS domain S-box protein n=1 Tax=Nodosilinea sp. LEGE 07298 TaxID=2777970 RepID=UPI00187F26C9|nr:PAS domain S-box protein [Nodosilinea sp. LEGE 07298]MBE9108109.1 PAS domain S-box protein [Nodosilinea sp. LEGE 07298]
MTEVLAVLIVDETEDDALLTVESLRGDGLAMTWARVQTAADLRPMLSTRRWDAIIADHSLPGIDALTALAIVREQGLELPFIVVSGTSGEQQAVALMKAGAQDYIGKGNLARLPEVVRREVRAAQNRLSEARLQRLVETQPGTLFTAVLRVNGDRAFTYLSSTGVNLFEVPIETALADFSALAALLHPEDRTGVDAAIAHSAATLTPLRHEGRIVTPSGQTKWVQVHGQPERLPNGDVQWFGTVLEVTDRKQAELTVTRQRDLNHLMMAVTQRFVEVRAAQFDTEVIRTLTQIGAYIQADHGQVVALPDAAAPPEATMRATHQWYRPNCPVVRQIPAAISMAALPWATAALRRREVINVPQVGALPADCATDRISWQRLDVGAVLSVPLIQQTRVVGYVGFLTLGRPTAWDDDTQQMVQVLAQTIASAQDRLQAERLLTRREAQSWAMLSVMPDLLIRVGADGRYREVLSQNHPLDIVLPSQSRIGRHVSEFFPADLADLKMQAIRQALATHEVQTYEQQISVGDRLQHEELRAVRCADDEVLFLIRDISERKQGEAERQRTELALQQNEAHQRALLKALPDLLVRLSKDGIYLEFAASPTFHVVGPLSDLVGTHVTESLPPVAAQQRLDAIAQALATKAIQFYEQDLSTAETFQIEEVRVVPYRDDEVLALVRDISDRKQSERQLKELNQSLAQQVVERTAALEEREARYRGLMEGASDAIVVADMEGHILEVNRRTEELFGRSRDQLIQMHQSQLHSPDHQTELIAFFQESIGLPHFQALNIPILHADGRHIPVDITSTAIDLGATRVTQSIFRDVSDRQRLEETLRLRERAIAASHNGIVITDARQPSNPIIYVNPAFERMTGFSAAEAMGHNCRFLQSNQLEQPSLDTLRQAIAAGEDCTVELINYRKNGEPFWNHLSVSPIYDPEGQLTHFVGIQTDISDRKRAEAQLHQHMHDLEEARHAAEAANQAKGEFLANMSHELRTPLNAILGMTEGLQAQVFGAINERQINALTTVETSASHLLALINDILDMAKIESGQITLHLTPTAIAPLCHASLTFVQQQADKKRIQLIDGIPPNLPDLVIDERRVRQILINLLANAVKFTPEGGRVSLTVALELCQNGDELRAVMRLTVKDTGIGIAPDDQQRLFQPFVQIDSALNRQYEGTGLGLTLVKQFTELHGGQVGLTSEVGVGSRFTIDLPYALGADRWSASGGTAVASAPESPTIPDQKPLILLASDQEATISTVVNYLTAKGYRLLVSREGEAAIAMAQTENPDLIVIDMQLPGGDGLEAICRLRDEPHLADRPIIALAAVGTASDRDPCLMAGANQHLGKPLKLRQLVAAIQHLLNPLATSSP